MTKHHVFFKNLFMCCINTSKGFNVIQSIKSQFAAHSLNYSSQAEFNLAGLHAAVVPHVQKFLLWIIGYHSQDAISRP